MLEVMPMPADNHGQQTASRLAPRRPAGAATPSADALARAKAMDQVGLHAVTGGEKRVGALARRFDA